MLQLTSTWTRIRPEQALPHQAEIDWVRGVARAPASWQLELASDRFMLCDEDDGEPIPIDPSDVFTLEDVRPEMSIGSILRQRVGS